MPSWVKRWGTSSVFLAAAVVLLVVDLVEGNMLSGVLTAVLLLAGGLVVSPALFPRGPALARAQEQAAERGVPLIYWKAGCSYCIRMRWGLGRAGQRAVWVDIWKDADAAAEVRRLNGGDETTPTVTVGRESRTNPSPAWVREHLALRS